MDFEPMSPEERERMMQFLLNQQAQFAADHAKSQERLDRVEDGLLTVVGVLGRLTDQCEQQFARLTASQARTDEQLNRTGERLDVVVNMFERHLREDHGIH